MAAGVFFWRLFPSHRKPSAIQTGLLRRLTQAPDTRHRCPELCAVTATFWCVGYQGRTLPASFGHDRVDSHFEAALEVPGIEAEVEGLEDDELLLLGISNDTTLSQAAERPCWLGWFHFPLPWQPWHWHTGTPCRFEEN